MIRSIMTLELTIFQSELVGFEEELIKMSSNLRDTFIKSAKRTKLLSIRIFKR